MPTTIQHTPTFGYRHPLRPDSVVTSFSVDVVDGNGEDVPREPVVARFAFAHGEDRTVRTTTDALGRATFVVEHDRDPLAVEILAAGEASGSITPAPGARLVIES